jgi:phospholipase C
MRLLICASLLCAACSGAGDDGGPRSTLTADQAQAARTSCTFAAGTLPGLSLAKDAPLGSQIPIDTVVVLMFENRSFDHMLSNLSGAEVAPAGVTNPDSSGKPIARYHDDKYCFEDTNHEWTGSHQEYDNGKNDGFVIANEDPTHALDGTRAMSYYTEQDLPFFYGLASNFAVADHNHCALLGPTFPNREYLYAATSYGSTDNNLFQDQRATIFDSLNAHNVTWHDYFGAIPGFGVFLNTYTSNLDNTTPNTDEFMSDAAAGKLPHVVFLDPNLRDEWGNGNDWHPPGDVQIAEQFLQQVVTAVTSSPQWPHMALIVTFDENGGLYDHVPPPNACPPDNIDPMVPPGGAMAKFDRYGFRVPLIVVSPYAKPHYIGHDVYDHTSILRFIEARFKLPALTARDANANPLFDLFDFSKPALLTPPQLPSSNVDPARKMSCANQFPLKPGPFSGADLSIPTDMATPDMGGTD